MDFGAWANDEYRVAGASAAGGALDTADADGE
jgi:endogenous inhibitor of DNA gyrase (YacG/DUF329 family)